MTIQQAIELAEKHRSVGQLREAASIYQQILSVEPNRADVLHLMGIVAYQSGQLDQAVELFNKAIAVDPRVPDFHGNLALALLAKNKWDQAVAACTNALRLRPDFPEARLNLAIALEQLGRLDEAINAYRRVLEARPDFAQAHFNLGNALHAQGQFEKAIQAYQTARGLCPNVPEIHNNLARALKDSRKLEEAIAAVRQAVALRPGYFEAWNNLASLLRDAGKVNESIDACRRAMALAPGRPEALTNLAHALKLKGQLDEAIKVYRQVAAIQPSPAVPLNNLGIAYLEKGQPDAAIAAYRDAITIQPDYALAHYNLGLTLLLKGDYEQGWQEHEWRWRTPELGLIRQQFVQPLWDGTGLAGRKILIHAEQGFGDTIQFARYIPMIRQRGGSVIMECRPGMRRLLSSLGPDTELLESGQPLPAFDVHCALMSLPMRFGTRLQSIPAEVPYLHADAALSDIWRQRLSKLEGNAKVGLVWAGRSEHSNDRNRSMPLSSLAPLAGGPGVQLISLQKGQAAAQVENARSLGMSIIDFTRDLIDFAETAALIANLDLVITVDTAAAHLAGALGKPVYLLLPFVPDWRWLLDRADSPWYPSMRIFRQPEIGDWLTPVMQIVRAMPR
jgi:tetratricopeptide (TPR) repeat protein